MRATRGKLVAAARDKIKDGCLDTKLAMHPARITNASPRRLDLRIHVANISTDSDDNYK